MAVIRKRLIFWLIKAYIKKSGKTILFSFLGGLIIFFILLFIGKYYSHIFPFTKEETVGLVGAYTEDSLPTDITSKIAIGLTIVAPDGSIQPGLASSWDIMDNGKTYQFHLKPGVHFYDGQEVTSNTINYNFSDVNEIKSDKYTIIFKLKDSYAPFLVTVSKPIFDKGFSGVGDYHLEKISTNGSFVQSLTLSSSKDTQSIINYEFFPSDDALKTAYLLGEISEIEGITSSSINGINPTSFPNTTITKQADYTQLVTLFFNNNDNYLSNKKIRLALAYATPDKFTQGTSAYSIYSPYSQYYNQDLDKRSQDLAHAQLLLQPDSTSSLSGQAKPPSNLTIKTFPKFRSTAESIAAAWEKLGIKTQIEEVDAMPTDYQVFLGDYNIPKDPDQYTLWHSEGPDNITHYKDLRIDKLLEDGRKTIDVTQRKSIYDDFQKFLLEDSPAVFLYYPTEYTITRK